jgi:methylenetetrahydrofolate dehydrogenase (NADP+)/methenyltetrahydrofolate cyclohydrolase
VLVGDDPGSALVRRRQAQGLCLDRITSIRHDLPATATQAEVEAVIDRAERRPACTGFIVQQPTGLDEFALLSRVSPAKDVDGLHPTNLGKLVLGKRGPLPCTRWASSSCCAVTACRSRVREVVVVGAG